MAVKEHNILHDLLKQIFGFDSFKGHQKLLS
jgi:hypothetical protein